MVYVQNVILATKKDREREKRERREREREREREETEPCLGYFNIVAVHICLPLSFRFWWS